MTDDLIKNIPVVSSGGATATTSTPIATGTDTKDAPSDGTEDPFSDVKKEIRTRYELLPEDIKAVIMDDGYQMKLFNIAKEQKLTYEELGTLEMEVTMVLLGMTKPEDFRDDLQTELKKNDPEIDALVKIANDQIFTPVRASLDKVYSAKKEPQDYITPATPPAAVAAEPSNPPLIETTPTSVAPNIPAPLPPKIPTPPQGLTAQEKTVLEKTGVVISETAPAVKPSAPMTMPSRADVLRGIENPTRAPSAGLVADKLAQAPMAVPSTKTTDYSVAKPAAPITPTPAPAPIQTASTPAPQVSPTAAPAAPRPTGPDPYREPLD